MKVIHIESGLGNQMLSYCELLAIRQEQPNEQFYIETLVYDFEEASEKICQWNGYELERVFGIKTPNIVDILTDEQKEIVYRSIRESRFWDRKWNWPVCFTVAFENAGISLLNTRGDFETNARGYNISDEGEPDLRYRLKQTGIYANVRRVYKTVKKDKYIKSDKDNLFYTGKEDAILGQRLTFKNVGNGIETIEEEIRRIFVFPDQAEERNRKLIDFLQNCESVAIHARRGDMLTCNGKYYRSGYFRRAVKYIKHNVKDPVYFFFCDPGSMEWCKQNSRIFGLDYNKDQVHFVDWNKGENSFRDMQLMGHCKHNIITNSSFGWWGAFLNKNPEKITISPEIEINTTWHC